MNPSPSPSLPAFRFRLHQLLAQLLRLPARSGDGLVRQRCFAAPQMGDGHGAAREFVAHLALLGTRGAANGWMVPYTKNELENHHL